MDILSLFYTSCDEKGKEVQRKKGGNVLYRQNKRHML